MSHYLFDVMLFPRHITDLLYQTCIDCKYFHDTLYFRFLQRVANINSILTFMILQVRSKIFQTVAKLSDVIL